jgi:LacI family transcriptional regulator
MNAVARLAGVSQTTVSLVINNVQSANIPSETRQRVLAAVSELNYRPNMVARTLRTQRSALIGLISDEIATTPYAGGIIEGTHDTAWEHEKILVVVNTKKDRHVENAAINTLLDHQVEGVIYAAMYHQPVTVPETLRNVPAVLLNCYDETGAFNSVVSDEFSGGRAATELLLEKGHRRIGFINFSVPIPGTVGRLAGHLAALSDYGIEHDDDLVVADDNSAEGGYRGARRLMQLRSRPSAIFCFSDRVAMGAYDALRKLDLRIPEDVAIVGFDNQEIIAAHLHPQLTTLELPHYEMGVWAVRRLMSLISRKDTEVPSHHQIKPRLVVRQSA